MLRDIVEEGPHELAELLIRRFVRAAARSRRARRRAVPADEVGHRPGDAKGQPAGDRRGEEEDEQAEGGDGGRQLRGLRLRDPLLRKEQEREEPGASHAGTPGSADEAVVISSNGRPATTRAPVFSPRPAEADGEEPTAGTRSGQKPGGVEVAAGVAARDAPSGEYTERSNPTALASQARRASSSSPSRPRPAVAEGR